MPAGTVALFPYLAGTTPADWPRWPSAVLTELGHTIVDLHSIAPSSGVLPFHERLAITIADDLRYHLADKAIRPFRSDVLDQLDRLYEFQRAARRRHPEYVVSHTDLVGDNILVSGDRLSVLDWDGALLAPRELDLAMLLHGEQPADATALEHTLAPFTPTYHSTASCSRSSSCAGTWRTSPREPSASTPAASRPKKPPTPTPASTSGAPRNGPTSTRLSPLSERSSANAD